MPLIQIPAELPPGIATKAAHHIPMTYEEAALAAPHLGMSILALMRGRSAPRKPKVTILAAASGEPFHDQLALDILDCLSRADMSGLLLSPRRNFDWPEHLLLRAEARKHPSDVLIIVMPFLEPDKEANLFRYIASLDKLVVVVDYYRRRGQPVPENARLVGASDLHGAWEAAKVMRELLLPRNKERYRVFALGEECKPVRVQVFADVLERILPGARVEYSLDAGTSIASAAEAADWFCKRAFKPGPPYDAVFSVSDWACYGSLNVHKLYAEKGFEPPVLLSFDGLPMTRLLVDQGIIAGTLVQDTRELATAAIGQIERFYGGIHSPDIILQPYAWRPTAESSRPTHDHDDAEELAGALEALAEWNELQLQSMDQRRHDDA